jgi:hypothetical protein
MELAELCCWEADPVMNQSTPHFWPTTDPFCNPICNLDVVYLFILSAINNLINLISLLLQNIISYFKDLTQ